MEFLIRRIAELYYNLRLQRRDSRDMPLVDWKKAEKVCNDILLFLIYAFYFLLFYFHFRNKNTIIIGILLTIVWLIFFSWFSFSIAGKGKDNWLAKLITASVLAFFLIIPVDKYEKVFIRPFERLSKIGPVEFFRDISKTECSDIAGEIKSMEKNCINNGGFEIPLFSKDSNWGTGKYSDLIRATNPYEPVYFIKFGGALVNADISSEESIGGKNSLHIRHESDKKDNVVGVLEQRVYLEPGKYELSMKAKLNYAVVPGAMWVRFYSAEAEWLEASGFDIPDTVPVFSSWVEKNKVFSIDNCGNFWDEKGNKLFCLEKNGEYNKKPVFSATFGIVTTAQCEAWIDNIKLTRAGD